jgi:ribosomal protein S18 acetylase RimI-like enzyme
MPQIEIRPARAEDRDAVLAFCAHTWESGDYITYVWDRWLHDTQGLLLVATSDGHPVGIDHLQMLNATDAWLEGLRVDPNYRHQGIAKAMGTALMAEAMRRRALRVRLISESTNAASLRLLEQTHMRQVGAFVSFFAAPLSVVPPGDVGVERVQLATADDLDEIVHYLNASSIFPGLGGFYYVEFKAYSMTDEFLEEKMAAQQVYLLRRWNRLDGLAIAERRGWEHGGKQLSVGYIDGTTIETISLIAYDFRRRLPELGLDQVYIYAPDLVMVHDALTGIDYQLDGKVFYTFERGLV